MQRPRFLTFLASIAAALAGCVNTRGTSSSASSPSAMSGMMRSMMGGKPGGMMMNVSQHDMSVYMEMFNRHSELRRRVELLPNGIRTTTESDNPHLAALLHEHVPDMWVHVNNGDEVRCMSNSLPTMFRNASKYNRQLQVTAKGVVVTETSEVPEVLAAIRRHAEEVSGFVRDGMPAMMRSMMGSP